MTKTERRSIEDWGRSSGKMGMVLSDTYYRGKGRNRKLHADSLRNIRFCCFTERTWPLFRAAYVEGRTR